MTNISDSEKAYHRCMMNHKESISRCSKLFYTISRCYFHIESTFSGASVSFVLSHIARYVPSPEENSCIPITHFQCKNNFEHLLSQKDMVRESTERNLKLDWAFTLSRFEGVAINEHFLLKACFSTLRGEACASTQYLWPLMAN